MLAGATLRAAGERRADRDGGVHAGNDVGDRHAGALRSAACAWFTGSAIGFAGNAHHPAHALDHEIVARPLAVRSGLAETGDRTIDQARVHALQIVIAQAVARKIAVLVVFDEHVAFARQRTN